MSPPHPVVEEWDADLAGGNPLDWPGYEPPAAESVVTGRTEHNAFIEGRFDVLGGSMGAVHGERVVRAWRRATDERLPMVVITSSGGARMQEGMVSLIQMARTAFAARQHSEGGLLSLAVFRNPTTGGVYASYGSLTDLRIAEPGATIGFAGPRVAEAVTGNPLPPGSHTAEFAYQHGLVDAIVEPDRQAGWVAGALGLAPTPADAGWPARLSSSWTPFGPARGGVEAGLATINRRRVVLVVVDGTSPTPSGYRLAQRAIGVADKIAAGVVTVVDTPGADPSSPSEADGIAGEIARTFGAMADVAGPTVALCAGTGGSGGALALAFADRLLMLPSATFWVIAPELAAVILHRDAGRAGDVATQLRGTSDDLVDLGIADAVVPDDEDLARAIGQALDEATPGDRLRRFDAATSRWVRG